MEAKQTQSYDIPLHDIKTIVDVEEYSLYYLLGTSFLVILVLGLLSYLVYLYIKKRNAFSIRKEHFKLLNNLDLNDTKRSAYAVCAYGSTFKDDSQRHKEMFENITNRLEIYKYKKEVENFDTQMLGFIEVYKGMIDV